MVTDVRMNRCGRQKWRADRWALGCASIRSTVAADDHVASAVRGTNWIWEMLFVWLSLVMDAPHKSPEIRDHSSIFNLQLSALASSFIPHKRFVPFVFTFPPSYVALYHVIINHMPMTWLEHGSLFLSSNGTQGCNEGKRGLLAMHYGKPA